MREMNSEYLSYAETTKAFLTEKGALKRLPELIRKFAESDFGGKRRFGIIADTHTQEAAGKALSELLESQNLFPLELAEPLIYPGSPILHADYKYIPEIAAYIRKNDCVPIAAGSGTINDLVKRAAYEAGTPYIVAGTAASVDGYASDGAALLENGMKHTKPCPAPTIIIADTEILEQAPKAMGAAGYADLIAKIPAGGDWILADALQEDPIEATAWYIVQHNLREWVSVPGDMEKVFSGLTASGIAMQYLKRSRPVSGAEHLFSHVWEMEGLTYRGETVSHGFKVGIGSLLSTALMEILQKLTITPQITEAAERCYPSRSQKRETLNRLFSGIPGRKILEAIVDEKYPDQEHLRRRLTKLQNQQDRIKTALSRQILPYEELKRRLKAAGCPVTPEEIGLSLEGALSAVKKAQLLRNRYTIIDAVDDLGMTDYFLEAVEQSSRYLR